MTSRHKWDNPFSVEQDPAATNALEEYTRPAYRGSGAKTDFLRDNSSFGRNNPHRPWGEGHTEATEEVSRQSGKDFRAGKPSRALNVFDRVYRRASVQ